MYTCLNDNICSHKQIYLSYVRTHKTSKLVEAILTTKYVSVCNMELKDIQRKQNNGHMKYVNPLINPFLYVSFANGVT